MSIIPEFNEAIDELETRFATISAEESHNEMLMDELAAILSDEHQTGLASTIPFALGCHARARTMYELGMSDQAGFFHGIGQLLLRQATAGLANLEVELVRSNEIPVQ